MALSMIYSKKKPQPFRVMALMDGQDKPVHIKVWINRFFSHKAKTKIQSHLDFGCHPKKD
jgi:macrodomain Ter protein organizer (MatP/YcbG family)